MLDLWGVPSPKIFYERRHSIRVGITGVFGKKSGFLPVVQGRVDGFPEIRRTDISAPDGFYNGIKYLNFTGNVIING